MAQLLTVQPRADTRAYLSLELTPRGEETVTLAAPGTPPQDLGPTLAQAFGCQASDLEPEAYAARLKVRCSIRPTASSGLHARFHLADLKDKLRALGVQQVQLAFAFPKLGEVAVSPAISTGEDYRMMSYALDDVPPEIAIDARINPAH